MLAEYRQIEHQIPRVDRSRRVIANRDPLSLLLMNSIEMLNLNCQVDDSSFQVSASNDQEFWFRLERERGQDVITDFFIGSVPEERAAAALIECYQLLRLIPQAVLVFRDIFPGDDLQSKSATGVGSLDEVQHLLAVCGRNVLRYYGAALVSDRLTQRRGKWDLIVECDQTEARAGRGNN